jgi:hypothetical protein
MKRLLLATATLAVASLTIPARASDPPIEFTERFAVLDDALPEGWKDPPRQVSLPPAPVVAPKVDPIAEALKRPAPAPAQERTYDHQDCPGGKLGSLLVKAGQTSGRRWASTDPALPLQGELPNRFLR